MRVSRGAYAMADSLMPRVRDLKASRRQYAEALGFIALAEIPGADDSVELINHHQRMDT